ncbi:MAG: TolC family outer membrane protein [Betaproteobacteria bacterium]|nr:TolC family outer membrane protein [Betaproteobacteria bacterium]
MKPNFVLKKSIVAVMVATAIGSAQAVKLEESVSKAVLTNPDVLAKFQQFKAAGSERDVSWGRYLPTLDYLFGVGEERQSSPTINPADTYSTKNQRLSLRQNVFEGFATQNDVARLEHAQLVRYYELLDISETAAAEAARAYIDVYRFRKLLAMAEENYATHRLIYDKINSRAKSGVGRGVDLEIAAARLALAESNLLTEASNLHDVNARYQRIIGEPPKGEIAPPPALLAKMLPKTRKEAIENGFSNSPQLKAAVENILSAQRNVDVQRGAYAPRVDLYAESSRIKNDSGVIGQTNTSSAGMTVSWNLFRGLQDKSRVEKASAEAQSAKEIRERVCRDLRQNLSTAFNDHLRLIEQLPFLDQHQLSTDKAREALRKQFDIGQRTLLDVLDTENEYYTASRNYVNGELDVATTQVKYLASSGKLLATLNLKHLDAEPPKPETALDADAVNQCPPEPAAYPDFDKNAVFNRAKAKEDLLRSSATQAIEKADAAAKPAAPEPRAVPASQPKPAAKAPAAKSK